MAGTKNLSAVLRNSPAVRREFEGPTGFEHKCPPQSVLDRIAERGYTRGYDLSRKNLCQSCWTYRFANGTCGCA